MQEQLKQIAERLQALREIQGMSAESLASALQIPYDTYLTYERGEADIPVSVLYQAARILGVELTDLLTGENPRLHRFCLVRRGKGVHVERRKEYSYQHLAFNFSHKKAEPFLVSVEPASDATPIAMNAHPGQEFDYVLNGTLKVVIDDNEMILEPGDSIYFDSNCQHGMQALNNLPAQFLAIIF